MDIKRAALGWGLTTLFFLAGGAALAGAVREWGAYHRIACMALAPDGVARRTPPLRSSAHCDYRVVIRGTFRGRFDGVLYDAMEGAAPGEEPSPHNALELAPPELAPVTPAAAPHVWRFVPEHGANLRGERIVARLDRERLTEGMELPETERDHALEGALSLEVWERDRFRQSGEAGGLAALGAACAATGFVRLRLQRRGRRRRLKSVAGNPRARTSRPAESHFLALKRLVHEE